MNSKQIIVLVGSVLVCGALLWTSSQPVPPQPGPGPTPGPVVDGIAQTAANDLATFGQSLSRISAEAAKKIESGELKSSKDAAAWFKSQADAARLESFRPWHVALDDAKRVDGTGESLEKLKAAWEQSAIGFAAAVKGK